MPWAIRPPSGRSSNRARVEMIGLAQLDLQRHRQADRPCAARRRSAKTSPPSIISRTARPSRPWKSVWPWASQRAAQRVQSSSTLSFSAGSARRRARPDAGADDVVDQHRHRRAASGLFRTRSRMRSRRIGAGGGDLGVGRGAGRAPAVGAAARAARRRRRGGGCRAPRGRRSAWPRPRGRDERQRPVERAPADVRRCSAHHRSPRRKPAKPATGQRLAAAGRELAPRWCGCGAAGRRRAVLDGLAVVGDAQGAGGDRRAAARRARSR